MKPLITGLVALAALTALAPARRAETFTGVITDDVCGRDGHAGMQMGPTDAECARLCVTAHGAAYVLYDGEQVYALSDQDTPYGFAGAQVTIVGTLDARTNTIQVESIAAVE